MGCPSRGAWLYFGRLNNAQLLVQSRACCNLSIYTIVKIYIYIYIVYLIDSTYAPVQRPHWTLCYCPRLLHCHCHSVQSPLRRVSLVANHNRKGCRSSTHVCQLPQILHPVIRTMSPVRHAVVNDWLRPGVIYQFYQYSQQKGNRCCCHFHCPGIASYSA